MGFHFLSFAALLVSSTAASRTAAHTERESASPASPPFSKSSSRVAIVFVTWARHTTGLFRTFPRVRSAAASISTETIPSVRREAMRLSVSRKGASVVHDGPCIVPGRTTQLVALTDRSDQRGIGIGIRAGRHVMAARPLVAQGPVDQEEEGRGKPFGHKPRRGDAYKGAASKSEQFLGDQDGKRGSDRAADHTVFGAPFPPTEEARMETGPGGILDGPSRVSEVLDKFPVEVQEASGRDGNLGHPLPNPRRLQQVCRREDRRFRRLVFQKRYPGVFSHGPPPSPSHP